LQQIGRAQQLLNTGFVKVMDHGLLQEGG
jgi:hypothetical protein